MNPNDILLFRCLCLDLGHEYMSSDAIILKVCQRLKETLMTFAEECPASGYTASLWPIEWFPFNGWGEGDFSFKIWYQIANWALKITASETTDDQEKAYIGSFLLNEESCRIWEPDDYAKSVISLARVILFHALPQLDLSYEKINQWYRHGPGAVYEGSVGSDKNYFRVPDGVARHYPVDSFYANPGLAFDCLHADSIRDPACGEGYCPNHARLALVPKDHRGPRGVFTHPIATVMVRQAQATALRTAFSRGPLRKCYNPENQESQQQLALEGSCTLSRFTLDLKDASDRIPVKLVRLLLPSWAVKLMAARVTHVELPSGRKHALRMFAPMGDPACFDVLSLVCLSVSLAAAALEEVDPGVSHWRATLRRVAWIEDNCSDVCCVFGDDVAGNAAYYSSIRRGLEAVNLKVNNAKTFIHGYFREACGMDAFCGVCVTPLRHRSPCSSEGIVGLIDLHNRIVITRPSWVNVIRTIRRIVRRLTKGVVAMTSDSVGEPLALQCLEDENPWTWNLYQTRWAFDVSLGELRIRVPGVTVRREVYPSSYDQRFDLNYWLLRSSQSATVQAKAWTVRRDVTGSPHQLECDARIRKEVQHLFPKPGKNLPSPRLVDRSTAGRRGQRR